MTHEPGDPVWTAVSGADGTGAVHVDALLEDLDAARAEQEDA